MNTRIEAIEQLEAAQRGEVIIHRWSSTMSPWMKLVAVQPGEAVDPQGGFPKAFAKDLQITHEGALDAESIETRLSELTSYQEA